MRIKFVVDDPKLKDDLIEVSKYLHEFTVHIRNKYKKTKIEVFDGNNYEEVREKDCCFGLDLDKLPMLNLLAHLYIADKIEPLIEIDTNEESWK